MLSRILEFFYRHSYSCHSHLTTINHIQCIISGIELFQAPLVKEIVFNPLYILASFVKDKVSICAWIYLWAFYFVPLIKISVFVPVPYCLDNCGFVIEPEKISFMYHRLELFFSEVGALQDSKMSKLTWDSPCFKGSTWKGKKKKTICHGSRFIKERTFEL